VDRRSLPFSTPAPRYKERPTSFPIAMLIRETQTGFLKPCELCIYKQ